MGQAKARGTYEQRRAEALSQKPEVVDCPHQQSVNQPVLTREALALYKPPFKYEMGYIWDDDGKMVADDGGACDRIARVRGWGHIQYVKDAEHTPDQLQDEVGRITAEALTLQWSYLSSEDKDQ